VGLTATLITLGTVIGLRVSWARAGLLKPRRVASSSRRRAATRESELERLSERIPEWGFEQAPDWEAERELDCALERALDWGRASMVGGLLSLMSWAEYQSVQWVWRLSVPPRSSLLQGRVTVTTSDRSVLPDAVVRKARQKAFGLRITFQSLPCQLAAA
jgi:hypothetical protein